MTAWINFRERIILESFAYAAVRLFQTDSMNLPSSSSCFATFDSIICLSGAERLGALSRSL